MDRRVDGRTGGQKDGKMDEQTGKWTRLHTGRIGSRQQLAENGWCPWGVFEVPRGIVGTIYTKSNLGSTENLYFEKLANFPYMHVETG